jgi:ethanolamine utilization protein EutP (predicted NTPase)
MNPEHNNFKFKAAELSARFKKAVDRFDHLLASTLSEEIVRIRKRLRDELGEYRQRGALTVAFIGQYSAGKSSIISALTGRRDIRIDADIATDTTTTYDWNNIKVIDTPGLFTDRPDHDEIAYEAISKADLLVFCLTHMLFDTLTVDNFKKLAYDKGYRWKIMLVINKMSAAAGDEKQKIDSYRTSLVEALKPYDLSEFPICFIDAKDYQEGTDEDDDFLVEISRFDSFIGELNRFVERRAHLTRLDTPARIALSRLNEAQIAFARDSNEDTAFLEVLSRLSRRVNRERESLRTVIKRISLEMTATIVAEGERLASAVGEPQFEELFRQAEIHVREAYEKAGDDFEGALERATNSIKQEVMDELQGDLTQAFVRRFSYNGAFSNPEFETATLGDQTRFQVEWLQKMGCGVGGKISDAAVRSFIPTASQGFLRSIDVVGSPLHNMVRGAGQLIGFKFRPWQAVGITKNIGNAAKFLGPIASVLTIGVEAHQMYQESKQEKAKADARRAFTSEFRKIAVDLEQQIESQLREFELQAYNQIDRNIAEAQERTVSGIAGSNEELKELQEIREKFENIILDIPPAQSL